MLYSLDNTHNPDLRSWVTSANQPNTDFPIQNLPFGVFRYRHSAAPARIGVAIGDWILDLFVCVQTGLFSELPDALQSACTATTLNPLMALGRESAYSLRHHLSHLLRAGRSPLAPQFLVGMADAEMILPAEIGDYTDFYASIFHATHVGKLFRPDNPLLPNYKYVPIAYHGRASSILPSDTPVKRPQGQHKPSNEAAPIFGLSQKLDYELEVGAFVGVGNALGKTISIDRAEEHLFGICLINDWSARDIQAWEYQPLGPFLAKSFATSLSSWIVTLDALAPFRCSAFPRQEGDPQPLPYLFSEVNASSGGIDITVEAWLQSAQMREQGVDAVRLSKTSFKQMYWTLAQMLTHHTSNGCNLRPGDLLASGTVSGPELGEQGCLIEITQGGATTIKLPTGELRSFLLDGDEVRLRGFCEKAEYPRIGFGECRGIVVSNPVEQPH